MARLGHAHLEWVAREACVDVLHVKGPTMDVSILGGPRSSTDADLLVRPSHLESFVGALRGRGWNAYDHFATSSAFEHSQTFLSPTWGTADVHRRFPGIHLDAGTAFDILWAGRRTQTVAGIECVVPERAAQLLLLLLHGARDRAGRGAQDIATGWDRAEESLRARVRQLSVELRAEVPLALALGEDLTPYAGRRELALWRSIDHPTTRSAEWRARILAEPTLRARIRTAGRAVLPNPTALEHRLGRPPTSAELATEPLRRVLRGIREVGRRDA